MDGFSVRNEDRVASATIRGFFSQVAACAYRWACLPDGEVLVTEGNEDIDVLVVENGVLVTATEESIKDLAAAISIRSEAVHKTVANFMESFAHYHAAGTQCAFVFTTTATVARQKTGEDAEPALSLDILRAWMALVPGAVEHARVANLFRELVRLLRAKAPHGINRNLASAIVYIWERELEEAFFNSVRWNFEAPQLGDWQSMLMAKLVEETRGNRSKAAAFMVRLVSEVWLTSCQDDAVARVLTREQFRAVHRDIDEQHRRWSTWDQMAAYTSWVSWEADHYTVALAEASDASWSSIVVGVNYLPLHDEDAVEEVVQQSASDPVVCTHARSMIASGDLDAAFWSDPVLQVRLMDLLRTIQTEIYCFLYNRPTGREDVIAALSLRGQRRRECVDVAADARVALLCGEDELAVRPFLARLMGVVASSIARWHGGGCEDSRRAMKWIAPKVKVIRDSEGRYWRLADLDPLVFDS